MPNFALSKIHIKAFTSGASNKTYKLIMSYWGYTTNSSVISEIQQQSQQQHSDSQANIDNNNQNWNNFNNSDISSSSKTPIDTQNVSDANNKQNQSINTIESAINTSNPNFWDTISIWVDTNTSTYIFDTMQAIFNTNQYLWYFVFAILTLGLAKFILGRG